LQPTAQAVGEHAEEATRPEKAKETAAARYTWAA